MDKVNVKRTMNMLEELYNLVGYKDFMLALFMWVRYGALFGTDEELEEVSRIIGRYDTLFNEYMEEDIQDVLGKYEI